MSRSSASLSPSLGSIGPLPNPPVWVIVGASRGIGREFVRQLLLRGDRVYAVIRDPANASDLWAIAASGRRGRCELLECDITSEESIVVFIIIFIDPSSSILTQAEIRSRYGCKKGLGQNRLSRPQRWNIEASKQGIRSVVFSSLAQPITST